MENITSHYLTTDFDKGTDVNKLIEHGVARKIAAIMPDKYTEVEVTVAEVGKNLYVTATYSIDGDAEIVAIHKEEVDVDPYTTAYDPYSLSEDFFFGNPRPNKKTETVEYTSTCGTTEGRGSRVETLPSGQGLGTVDKDMSYFRRKLMKGLAAPTNPQPVTPKPQIDFSSISLLNEPVGRELPRYETSVHVGIDLAKVDVKDEITTQMAKEISAEIDKQIMNDIMGAVKGMTATATEKTISEWAVPTFGWTEEATTWDKPADITWKTNFGNMPVSHNPFGVITSNNTAPVWYNPNGSLMEEISFTEDELDELIELMNTSESKVMEFA